MTYSSFVPKKAGDASRRLSRPLQVYVDGGSSAVDHSEGQTETADLAGNSTTEGPSKFSKSAQMAALRRELGKRRGKSRWKNQQELMAALAVYHLGLDKAAMGLPAGRAGVLAQTSVRLGKATHFIEGDADGVVRSLLQDEAFHSKLRVLITESLEAKLVHVPGDTVGEDLSSGDSLANARARGLAGMRAELNSSENLSLRDAAAASGQSEKHVNSLRNGGRLYALVLDGATRHFRYPRWQFEADPRRLTPVLAALGAKGISCWAVHDFMKRPHSDLGQPPMHAILDTTVPVEVIIAAVHQRFNDSDQGAA